MNVAKLDDIREAHQRLRDEYRLALDRAADAQSTVTLAEANADEGEEPSARLISARQRLAKVRAEAQVLARRLRGSQTVMDKLDGYGTLRSAR